MANELRTDHGGTFRRQATVDPANHTAGSLVSTNVTIADARSTDDIVAIPPSTLETGIVVISAICSTDGTVALRTYNPTAGAIDPASATWTFVFFRR